jgi:hypothetical protein
MEYRQFVKYAVILIASGAIVWGAAMIVWSRELSERYNGWTTRIRQRYPRFSGPPTPKMREVNTRIMTWIIRAFGVEVALVATWTQIKFWNIP